VSGTTLPIGRCEYKKGGRMNAVERDQVLSFIRYLGFNPELVTNVEIDAFEVRLRVLVPGAVRDGQPLSKEITLEMV